jgi:hypothetical protein
MSMRAMVVVLLGLMPACAVAEGSNAGFGMGGNYARFDPVVAQYNASGELFRISGHCQSSCTLFLGIRNVCIERSASLLFHSAHDRDRNPSPSRTVHMLDAYNPKLRAYVTANHYMDTLALHTISGAAMISRFGYRECPKR